MCLNWEGETCLGHWIEMQFLRDSEYLYLVGNGANNVDLTKLENIRCLELGECESMKSAPVFPSIEHLNLFYLPKLEEIWDRRVSLNCFRILKELKLNHLPALKQLWKSNQDDLGKDFLPQLEVLEILECELMEVVFLWKGEDGNENNSCHHTTKMFPKLKEVSLYKLPNLISFCQGIEGIEFPLMRTIWIEACEKMKGMVANGMSNENNSGGSSNSNAADTIHLLCEIQQVSLLRTQRNPFCSHTIHVSLFYGLEELIISDCGRSMSLFTSSMAENIVNLKALHVSDCGEMVEVIKDDEEKCMSGGRQRALLFPKLQSLRLRDLPKLVSFCEWKCDVDLPPLREVEIIGCPNMKNFTLGSLATPSQLFKTDLNNYLLQVPFNSLKKLSVERNENPLNCYQIHGSIFDGLEVLHISSYQGGMSLFSSSITGNLVNLTRLTIWNSCEMVKVIEDEDEDEKEKVVSGGQRTLLFPKLNMLELWSLPKLVSFCEWKCDVELPSLRELNIVSCDNMKSFTLGHLNTPKLDKVEIDTQHFGVVKDLNDFLQQRYSNQTKERTTNIPANKF